MSKSMMDRLHPDLVGPVQAMQNMPGGDNISCYAAASRADDLTGLPPAFIAVGDLDLFAEEDVEYARRLIHAGVPVELHVYPGGCHAFDGLAPEADISRQFTDDFYRELKRTLHG